MHVQCYSSEVHDERLKAALAELQVIALRAEQAIEELARRMRGVPDTPAGLRSDEIGAAAMARAQRRDSPAAH